MNKYTYELIRTILALGSIGYIIYNDWSFWLIILVLILIYDRTEEEGKV